MPSLTALREPHNRVRAAWVLLIVCVIGWPVTSITIFANEPQAVLGLSWIALMMTALNIVVTTDVRREQDDDSA